MATVNFTQALKRFYPQLETLEIAVDNVNEVIKSIETKFPGIENYLVDDQRVLRKHVNIFVDGSLIKDREQLTDTLTSDSEVYIMQALSGG
jgi:molybdopterin converting factor small subunit